MQPPEPMPGEPGPTPEPPGTAPYYASPAAPPPRRPRSLAPLIAIVAVILLALVFGGGYLVGGYLYAHSRLDAATKAYNTATDHQNSVTDFLNSLNTKVSSIDPSAPRNSVEQAKTLFQQLVARSQQSEPQVEADYAALTDADAKLKQNQWLTAMSRSSMDKESNKIGYLRAALATAKAIISDYGQYGKFVLALLDCATDIANLEDGATSHNVVAVSAALSALKADAAKGIALDHAPGLAPEVDGFMHTLQRLGDDFTALVNAAAASDQAAVTKAEAAVTEDGNRLDTYDFTGVDKNAKEFYQTLIDQYNSYVAQANKA